MYSQNNEEEVILDYFQSRKGYFIDIGGYNPFKFSNTRRLYELGWHGIYIEPSPICFKSFVNEYEGNPRISLINRAVVTDERTHITFFESGGDAVSTSSEEHKLKWELSGSKFNAIEVPTISVSEVEKLFSANRIDFLSLDVESTNIEIFNAFSDTFLFNLSCICIEHDSQTDIITNRLSKLGYRILILNPENIILAK
jgi:FkbM family methyltransferase